MVPKRLQFIHGFLANQVGILFMRWGIYTKVYRADLPIRNILHWGAPGLFGMLDQALLDSIVLTLVRLFDYPGSTFQKNATFERLASGIRSARLRREFDVAVDPARLFAQAFRVRRNKQLAHSDLRVAQGRFPKAWPNKTIADLEAAITSCGNALNAVARHYGQAVTDFEEFAQMASCVDELVERLNLLRKGR